MVPTQVTPDDEHLRGDAWSCQILLDPSEDWSASTFTVDTQPSTVGVTLDASHRADTAPYVLLTLTAAQTAAAPASFRWNLSEDLVLGRTFLARRVGLVAR